MSLQTRLASAFGRIAKEINEVRDGVGQNRRLAPFHLALANQKNTPCNIFVLADSVGEGAVTSDPLDGRWQGVMARSLRDETGGQGYLPAWFTSPFVTNPATFSHTPVIVGTTGSPPVQFDDSASSIGPASRRIGLQKGGWVEWTFIGDRVRVWYDTTNFFARDGAVTIDGVLYTTLVGGASTSEGMLSWTSPTLARGKHTVRVTEPGNVVGSFWLEAVQFFDGDADKGVHIYDGSRGGATASYFANVGNPWPASMAKTNPHLVVIFLGFNDGTEVTPAQFTTNLRNLSNRIRAQLTDGTYTLAFVSSWAPAPPPAAGWAGYVAAMDTVANEHPTGVHVRLIDRWPVMVANAGNVGMWAKDTIHPSESGQRLIGRYLADTFALSSKPVRLPYAVWKPAPLVNGWENYGGSYPNAEYMITTEGRVHLRGMIRNGTSNVAIQLPPDVAPSGQEIFATVGRNAGFVRVDVTRDARVQLTQDTPGDWAPINGISWSTAASEKG